MHYGNLFVSSYSSVDHPPVRIEAMISVLYVDDEQGFLELAQLFLEQSGDFSVKTAISAQEALDSPAIRSCDAIVSDYHMQGMDGITFLKVVRERFGDIPFVLFTGRGREEVVIEAINNGADFYLQKGGDPEAQFAELAHKIRQAVRTRQAERSLHDSERRLSDIIDFLPDATFAIDRSGHVIAWNRTIEEMTGIPARDMLGKGNFEYAVPFYGSRRPILIDMVIEPDKKNEAFYPHVYRIGSSITAETDLPHPKGHRISALGKAGPLYNQAGEITGAIESIRDITELKKNEMELRAAYQQVTATEEELRLQYDDLLTANEQLAAAKQELRRQVDHLAESERTLRVNEERLAMAQKIGRTGSWEYKIESNTIWGSAEALRIFGYPAIAGDFPINDIEACIPERERVHQALIDLLTTGKEYDLEYEIHPADGSDPKTIHSVARFEKDTAGKAFRIMGVIRDITEGKAAESALRKSRQMLTKAMDLAHLANWEYDTETGIFTFDDHFYSLYGTSVEREGGTRMTAETYAREFVHPDDREMVAREIKKALETTDPRYLSTVEHRIIRRDGEIRHIIVSIGITKDSQGRTIATHGANQDITERKKAEEALRESEEKYRDIFNNTNDAIQIIELDENGNAGRFIDVNEPTCRMLQYTYDEILRTHLSDIEKDYSRKSMDTLEKEMKRSGSPTFETELIRKDGVRIPVEVSAHPVMLKGRHVGISVMRNVTERRKAESALRESEEKFRALVETSPDIIWEIDPQGTMRYISPMVETILGYTPEELAGKPIAGLIREQARPLVMQELARFASSEGPCVPFEVPVHDRNGRDRVIEIRPSRVKDTDGNLIGLRGVAIDVTERKKADDALRRANRQLSLLTGITRHDILNKITVILGYLKIAKKKCTDPGQAGSLEKIESTITTIRSQIEFTRIYQDLGTRDPQWIGLETIMPRSQVPSTISLTADLKGVTVFADPMFEKVFTNLLDNSIRHGKQVTEISVSSRRDGDALVVVWEDNGVGVAGDEKEQIFERGFGKHTGLGLFLVREILALSGITIRETGDPGRGARFEIRVPDGEYRIAANT